MKALTLAFVTGLAWAGTTLAQDDAASQPAASGNANANGKGKPLAGDVEILRAPEEEPVEPKTFTRARVEKICSKYEGRLVAYYDDIYRIEKCKRRPLLRSSTVYELQRKGQKVQDVSSEVIAAVPEGEPIDVAMNAANARGCKALDGKYVAFSSSEVYFVEKCQKRIFPDWSTYTKHREERGEKKGIKNAANSGEILILSWLEFENLPEGQPMPSVLDDMYKKMLSSMEEPDVIPIDEACRGVDGKTVTYYSRLYKIERCRKREFEDPETFFRRHGREKLKLKELTGEQWLSLPNGRPMEDAAPKLGKVQAPLSDYSPE